MENGEKMNDLNTFFETLVDSIENSNFSLNVNDFLIDLKNLTTNTFQSFFDIIDDEINGGEDENNE